MKKFLAITSVVVPLTLAAVAPAQAGHPQRSLDFEDVLRALILSQVETHEVSAQRDRGHHRHQQDRGWHDQRRIIPIPQLVRQIQRETGGRVTDVKLRRNGRVYIIDGIGPRGRHVTAKADARTGRIYDVQRVRGGHGHHAAHGKPIPALLRGLRNQGYYAFDRVVRNGNRYVVRGLDSRGVPVRIVTRARNGRILSVNNARNYNGPQHLRRQVRGFDQWLPGLRQQHYSHFGQATRHDDYYQVGARDRRGRDVTLRVCARTGNVLHTAYR